jgi:hypothetical protein
LCRDWLTKVEQTFLNPSGEAPPMNPKLVERRADICPAAPYVLSCECGVYFPCSTSRLCPYGCPWREHCQRASLRLGRGPVGTLRAKCPSCGRETLFNSDGRAIAFPFGRPVRQKDIDADASRRVAVPPPIGGDQEVGVPGPLPILRRALRGRRYAAMGTGAGPIWSVPDPTAGPAETPER